MRCKPPDKQFFSEVRDLNIAFLGLVADPRAGTAGLDMLGLAPPSAAAVAGLSSEELRRIAAVPVPLAGFHALPSPSAVAEQPPQAAALDASWRLAAEFYAAGLLTYLWQLARHQPVAAALCVGPGQGRVKQLARLSFDTIQGCAAVAAPQLRARPAFSAKLLPGLVRAARTPVDDCRPLGLDLIPLGLAGLRPARGPRRRG
jgi:hypothetical protein